MKPDVVVLAHTAVSYLTGFASEPPLLDRLNELAGTRATTAARAILAAFEQLRVRRIALATPYPEAIAAAGADAVLISGTGLPTAGIVGRLESELDKPVVTSQTATLWWALRTVGIKEPVRGYGRLLTS